MGNAKKELPVGWYRLEKGDMDSEAVKAGGRWFAVYDRDIRRVLRRPLDCRIFYRVEFSEKGATEQRIMVASDGSYALD